jgi:outer membrane protein OmpA-like peptidoglycan-associated protein
MTKRMEEPVELTNLLKSNTLRFTYAGALAASLMACTSTTSPQLADARDAYQDAEASSAPERAPGALAEARVALDRAERAHEQDPGSEREIDLAERAEKKAHFAQARGEARDARVDNRRALRAEPVVSERPVVRRDVHETRDTPKNARNANAAMQSLAQVANVKEEPRGYVITLSGELLFPSGDQDVSPVANRSLDQVADALAQQPSDTTFQIEGYTDNTGSEDQNRSLSAKRAQAVADKLSRAGIDPDRIRVVGRGEDGPIADNDTAEGRATNRRVEIIVDRNSRS